MLIRFIIKVITDKEKHVHHFAFFFGGGSLPAVVTLGAWEIYGITGRVNILRSVLLICNLGENKTHILVKNDTIQLFKNDCIADGV